MNSWLSRLLRTRLPESHLAHIKSYSKPVPLVSMYCIIFFIKSAGVTCQIISSHIPKSPIGSLFICLDKFVAQDPRFLRFWGIDICFAAAVHEVAPLFTRMPPRTDFPVAHRVSVPSARAQGVFGAKWHTDTLMMMDDDAPRRERIDGNLFFFNGDKKKNGRW